MVDGTVGIAQCPTPDRLMDNEVLTIGPNQVYRQRVQDPEALVKLDAAVAELANILAALGMTLNVDVGNLPADYPLPAGQVTTLTPQTDGLTDTELRATPVAVSGTVTVNEPVTVDGTVGVSSVGGTVAVSGPLTDTQLRAAAVPVSGPLTDVQVRATPLPVSGTVGVSGSVAVTGPLTDTQLRATAPAVLQANSFVPVRYDEFAGTYTGDRLDVAVFKLAAVTVRTLTLSYTGTNLTGVVAS